MMTEETPGKVMGLLALSLCSMAFLFAVTLSNASFQRVYNPLPDPFGASSVMAALDNTSHDYAYFVHTQLVVPGEQSYAMAADNLAFIGQNGSYEVMAYLGLPTGSPVAPQVAGAYTERTENSSVGIGMLYHSLTR